MADVLEWFKQIPPITRHWFGLSIFFPILGRIGLIQPMWCILLPDFLKNFELWRPITALFYYPITSGNGLHYLMNLYFLYNYSLNLETGHFSMKPADYLFMLIINWIATVLIAYFMNLMILMDPMVLSVIYVWCQLNKETIVRFWFGTKFKAMYLPWVLLGFNVLINGGGLMEIIGIVVGHLYYFAVFTYPQEHGGQPLITTPKFLENFLPPYQNNRAGFTYVPPTNTNNNQSSSSVFRGGHNWGRGHVLGGS